MVSLKTSGIVVSWGAVLGWMGLIFYFSQQPAVAATAISFPILRLLPEWTLQWVYHGSVFGVLSALVYVAIRLTFSWPWFAIGIVAFVLSVGYGVTDEFHQYFVSGRSADAADVGRDAIGAFFVVACVHISIVVTTKLMSRRSYPDR